MHKPAEGHLKKGLGKCWEGDFHDIMEVDVFNKTVAADVI